MAFLVYTTWTRIDGFFINYRVAPLKNEGVAPVAVSLQDFHNAHGIKWIVIPANPEFRLDRISPSRPNHVATVMLADKLAAAGIRPASVVFGKADWSKGQYEYRSIVAYEFSRHLVNECGCIVKVTTSSALTHIRYTDFVGTRERVMHGDVKVVHEYLSEKSGSRPVWAESAEAFVTRFDGIWVEEYPAPAVLIVPIEAMIYTYYSKIRGLSFTKIPYEGDVWTPTAGAGIAIAVDGTAVEFDRDLAIVAAPAAV